MTLAKDKNKIYNEIEEDNFPLFYNQRSNLPEIEIKKELNRLSTTSLKIIFNNSLDNFSSKKITESESPNVTLNENNPSLLYNPSSYFLELEKEIEEDTDPLSRNSRKISFLKNFISDHVSENPTKPKSQTAVTITASFNRTVLLYANFDTRKKIEALRQYAVVMESADRNPAVLYKLRDLLTGISSDYIAALLAPGRVYQPCGHSWDINSVWVLAHIHKQSEFMVMSAVTPSNVMRAHASQRYSAFAREIATVMQVGYEVTRITYQYHQQTTYLSPTKTREESLEITIMDCQAGPEFCQKGIALYHASVAAYQSLHPKTSTSTQVPAIPNPSPSVDSELHNLNRKRLYAMLQELEARLESDIKIKSNNFKYPDVRFFKNKILSEIFINRLPDKTVGSEKLSMPEQGPSEELYNFKKLYA